MDKTQVVELVQKLLRLGDKSRNNSEAEAEVATKKAMELLQKYNLDLSDVAFQDGEKIDPRLKIEHEIVFELKRSSMSSWEKYLIIVVQEATDTKGYFSKYQRFRSIIWKVGYIGTELDRAVAKELYLYLHSVIYRMSKQLYPDSMSSQRSFMEGFTNRLGERIREQKENFQKAQAENDKYTLMVVSKKDMIDEYGKNALALKTSHGRRGGGEFDYDAYTKGKEEADKVDIGLKNRMTESAGKSPEHKYE